MRSTLALVRPVSLVAVLASSLLAQGVVPPSWAASEASGSTNVPFGRSTGMRVQMVYDGSLFSGPLTITQLALRVDGGLTAAAKLADFEVAMGTGPSPLVQVRPDFAQNRGGDFAVVRSRRTETLPAATTATSPNPFGLVLTLDQGFAYDPALGPLVVEITVHSQQPGPYTLDASYLCQSPMVPVGPPGCGPAGGPALRAVTTASGILWGRTVTLQVLDAQPGTFTVLVAGSTDTGMWNGWSLPADLGPLGAPGCPVSIDQTGVLHGIADGAGTATFTIPVPNNPALQGLWVYFQGGAVDVQANALGVVTSQAFRVEVCGWEKVARVYAPGSAATTGVVEIGVAPILDLR